jgi:membrane associated rhomboid family serine protease
LIPIRDDNPTRRVPLVTRALIALNVACFAYEVSLGRGISMFVYEWGMVPLRLTHALDGAEPFAMPALTLVPSTFLHGGLMHLAGEFRRPLIARASRRPDPRPSPGAWVE